MPHSTASAFLVEASWEVANKVGGIYTVLATKLQHAQAHFPERYLPVGPVVNAQNRDFQEQAIPEWLRPVADTLSTRGISLHYGAWELPGKPAAILLGWEGLVSQSDAIKAGYWEHFQLDTLGSDFNDVDQPLLWSTAVGHFAAELAANLDIPVLLHAHEWLSGGAILAINERKAPVKTVFTTHATVLGRALSSEDTFIYDKLDSFDAEKEARRLNVLTKHQIERISAQQATVFTTVSTITAKEGTAFLGRTPQVVENGVDSALFPTYDQIVHERPRLRQRLDDLVTAYFFPSYRFDISKTKYAFTMGRYEYRNKGYDLALASLGQLNEQLKASKSGENVVAFFFVPGDNLRLRPEVTRQLTTHQHLKTLLEGFSRGEDRRIEREIWDDVECSCTLMPDTARDTARRLLDQVRTDTAPPISPFELRHPEQDAILQGAREYGLDNRKEDPVKILFFPVYLDGFDGAFNLPLYDLVSACDLGLFPSRYEPWGYTPMESLILGVPAVTSSLAGFGDAAPPSAGLFLLDRDCADYPAECTALTEYLHTFIKENERAWVARRLAAYQSMAVFDWSVLYPKYLEQYKVALT
jgi:glycogen(starch) synthase